MLQLLGELVLDLVQLLEGKGAEVNCGLTQMSTRDVLNAIFERVTSGERICIALLLHTCLRLGLALGEIGGHDLKALLESSRFGAVFRSPSIYKLLSRAKAARQASGIASKFPLRSRLSGQLKKFITATRWSHYEFLELSPNSSFPNKLSTASAGETTWR